MDKKLFWKILVGCSLALIALITIVTSITVSFVTALQPLFIPIIIGISVLGALLTIAGVVKLFHQRETTPAPADSSVHENPLAFLGGAQFWGIILLISVLPTYFLCKRYMRRPPPPPPPVAKVAPVAVPEVKFPPMKVTGIVYNGDKSTAVINGRTVQVGEMIEGVRVVSIKPGVITLELSGKTKELQVEE